MCAYFLGKGMDGNMDDLFPGLGANKPDCLRKCREQLALDPGFDYQGCVDGCGGMRVQPGEVSGQGDVGFPGEPPLGPVTPPVTGEETPLDLDGTADTQASSDWMDKLIAGMFGKEFETVRGVGGRTREATFDALARQGLLGTGATKGVAQDIAWQTERGISDLMRWSEMWKYQQEQDVMNQILQYFFGMGSMYR